MPDIGFDLKQRDLPDIPGPHKTRYREGGPAAPNSQGCVRISLLVGLLWAGDGFMELIMFLIRVRIVQRGRSVSDLSIALQPDDPNGYGIPICFSHRSPFISYRYVDRRQPIPVSLTITNRNLS